MNAVSKVSYSEYIKSAVRMITPNVCDELAEETLVLLVECLV